ncbi:unnamed protein product [Tuber melanosporum]|uniref:(Perigord truffle) hypothetical protein n=1 Tax=Tuber melanosporum (strain Mel28) TaxID=656061 RepID=D5G998_TUBMM|nr:uncharacterized protein GSTUM_00003210001 [Tuber melanosporum]CAZ81091.1 unnamed protein product [Tuber melanosporum]
MADHSPSSRKSGVYATVPICISQIVLLGLRCFAHSLGCHFATTANTHGSFLCYGMQHTCPPSFPLVCWGNERNTASSLCWSRLRRCAVGSVHDPTCRGL